LQQGPSQFRNRDARWCWNLSPHVSDQSPFGANDRAAPTGRHAEGRKIKVVREVGEELMDINHNQMKVNQEWELGYLKGLPKPKRMFTNFILAVSFVLTIMLAYGLSVVLDVL
jgi:hypothetical protein